MTRLRGNLGDAQRAVAAADQELAATGPQLGSDWLLWAKALVLEARGQPDASLATLCRAWDECVDQGLVSTLPLLGPDLVRLAQAAGDRQPAEQATTAIEDIAVRNPGVATLAGVALRCRGLLEDDAAVLVRAVDAYRAGPRPLELALACEDAARTLGAAGRVGEARPLFDDALGLYERLEAAWDLARAAARLRAVGIRPGRRGPRKRPKSGWDSLTTTEHKVVRLVAEGRARTVTSWIASSLAPASTASNSACSRGEVVWWTTSSLAIAVQGGVPAEQAQRRVPMRTLAQSCASRSGRAPIGRER
jgi:hypothetical protein